MSAKDAEEEIDSVHSDMDSDDDSNDIYHTTPNTKEPYYGHELTIYKGRQSTKDPWQAVDYAKKSCDGWIVLPDGTANDIPCRRSRGIHPSGKTVHPSQDFFA